ncbi:MAG: M23 family metallopeptidase [Chloroflexota bacterium]
MKSPAPAVLIIALVLFVTACRPQPVEGTQQPTATATAAVPTATDSATVLPTPTPTSTPTPTPCVPEVSYCIQPGHFLLQRPISSTDGNAWVDPTYRYGSTANGVRQVHSGVEFLNESGTGVLAAADGIVVYAGNDSQVVFGPRGYYYGNLVILEHHFEGIPEPVFSLYAHLSEVLVEPDQRVNAGDEIGRVGMTGIATGSHLHFEVRYGSNTFANTRNPELWLRPQADDSGQAFGALAVRIVNPQGQALQVFPEVQYLPVPGGDPALVYYPEVYGWEANPDDILGESFALGDLPAGEYRIIFIWNYRLVERRVMVEPGMLTFAEIVIDY